MKPLLILITFFSLSIGALAQNENKTPKQTKKEQKRDRINALIKQEEEGVIAYKKHFVFGIKLNTDGYGIFFEKGFGKSIRKATLFQMEITERKHPKEEKQGGSLVSSAPLIYGKLNFFYPIKLGVQMQYLLGNKSNKNGVSVTGNVGGGICLGLLRAYEMEIDDISGRKFIRYNSPDSLRFANPTGLNPAGPGFGKGWNNLKVIPGFYIKPAIRFDYGRYNEVVSAIEVGLTAEYYTKKIPQMLYNKENSLFFSAYVAMAFGKRK